MTYRQWLPVLFILSMLSACATDGDAPADESNAAAQELSVGIKSYEEGKYAEAQRLLQSSLKGELSVADQVNANKHLAFIHCAANRIAPCRDHFRQALKLDPKFELSAAEVGHPIWGPIYRSVKSGR